MEIAVIIFVSFIIGAFFGILIMSLLNASSDKTDIQ